MFATIVGFLLEHLVFSLMLAVGCSARAKDFADVRRRPHLYARALAAIVLGVPLLAMGAVRIFDPPPRAAGLILLMSVCPGAPFIATAAKAKGATHSPVGLNLLVLMSALVPVTVPIWVAVLDRLYPIGLEITPVQVLRTVIPSVLLPLVVGIVVRRLTPRAADVLARVAHGFFLVALAVAFVIALALGAPVFREVTPITFLAVLIVVMGSALLGYWAARPAPEARQVLAVSAVLGNPGVALAIIAATSPGLKAAAFMAAYVLLRKLELIPFEQWLKHRKLPEARPPADLAAPVGRSEVAARRGSQRPLEPDADAVLPVVERESGELRDRHREV